MLVRVVPCLIGLLSASSFAQAGPGAFVPGHIYVTEIGTEGCFEQRCWIRAIDPETGESWIFADHEDGLCDNSGLRFTPDSSRLRVLNLSNDSIQDYDAEGNSTTIYDGSHGLSGPFGGNGLAWDRQGGFYVANEYSNQIMHFPCQGCPATVFADWSSGPVGGGGLAIAPEQSLWLARDQVLSFLPNGDIIRFDDFGTAIDAHSLGFDRRGNLFVCGDESGVGGVILRYVGSDPSTRKVLTMGLPLTTRNAIDFSPDESRLYYAGNRDLIAIDIRNGSTRAIFRTPDEQPGTFVRRLGRGIAVYKAPKPGDMNCDNWVNNFDIDPFVLALSDEAGYQARFGWCDRTRADMNADGAINSFDIDGFVAAVVGDAGE